MSDVEAKLREKGLTADRIDEFRVAFQMFDINETGFITAENIGALLIGQFGACTLDDWWCKNGGYSLSRGCTCCCLGGAWPGVDMNRSNLHCRGP